MDLAAGLGLMGIFAGAAAGAYAGAFGYGTEYYGSFSGRKSSFLKSFGTGFGMFSLVTAIGAPALGGLGYGTGKAVLAFQQLIADPNLSNANTDCLRNAPIGTKVTVTKLPSGTLKCTVSGP